MQRVLQLCGCYLQCIGPIFENTFPADKNNKKVSIETMNFSKQEEKPSKKK